MIDITQSNEVSLHGESISDEDGNIIYWRGAGNGVPLHQAPKSSEYRDLSTGIVYIQEDIGLASNWQAVASSTSTDHHSGWRVIISGQVVKVNARQEMRVKRRIKNRGRLHNCGRIVID